MTTEVAAEIDVEQVMAEIREAVALRASEGRRSLASASLELSAVLAAVDEPVMGQVELAALELQPEFIPSEDDHYHINDLLQYHDHAFIWNAYRAILKREPDQPGLDQFLKLLRSGRLNKIDILASLRYSVEGKSKDVRVDGLGPRPLVRRLYRVPILGYLLEMIVAVARLPVMIHSRRQFEEHALAQQDLLAAHMNHISRTNFGVTESFPRELAEVTAMQKRFADLQHHQVVGLFREQRETSQRLEKLADELKAHLKGLQRGQAENVNRALGNGSFNPEESRELDEFFVSFADEFRGSREEVKKNLRHYLPILKAMNIQDGILDIGCGRGEWLELLKEEGFQASGIENNRLMVEQLRSFGLEVIEEDALVRLTNIADESLNAVTAFHFIEHLTFEALIRLLDQTARVLREGGLIIFETPNPKNLVVGACNFLSDPTHHKPLFPETVQFILSKRGFADVRIEYVNAVEGSPFTDDNQGSRALDSWFYSPRDFAVIGTKARE